MPARTILALAAALAGAAVPAAAQDVPVAVPAGLLGGTVPSGLVPAGTVAAPGPSGADALDEADGVDPADPAFWELVWPVDITPLPAPDDTAGCPDGADECVLAGDDPLPAPGATEAALPGRPAPATTAAARALTPRFGTWLPGQRPTLRWRGTPGADLYNVQVLLGRTRVVNAWTRGTSLTLPAGAIDQGRYYMWAVWPGTGPASAPVYGAPLGRSIFGVILRPRIVFTTPGGRRGRAVGEVRPHIPGGTLALTAPRDIAGRIPRRVRVDAAGRIHLNVARSDASRLSARLLDAGPRPPKGLRRR